MTIPERAVEAAALVMARRKYGQMSSLLSLPIPARNVMLQHAREILTAALPLMGVQRPESISPSDPLVTIAGIRQFGLASDGSDLRDLEAAFTRLNADPVGVQRPEDVAGAAARRETVARALSIALLGDDVEWKAHLTLADRFADAVFALPHTGQPQEGEWRLVPVEPTEAMATAVLEQTWLGEEPIHVTWEMVAEVLRVMFSAAPASPRETGAECERRLLDEEAADNLRLIDWIADKIGLPKNEELSRENFAQWLSARAPASPRAEGEDDERFKAMARIVYETAEFGHKREWEALPDTAKLTWYVALKRAVIADQRQPETK